MAESDFWYAQLREEGRTRQFKRGERLFLQGFGRGKVLIIHSGTLRITGTTFDGEEVTLALCREGDIVGSHSALTGGPVGAGAEAIEDGSATILTADRYVELLSASPELMIDEIRDLIAMLHNAEERLIDIATEDVDARIARQLRRLCRDRATPVALPLTQTDLASMVGAARATVAPVLADLRERGAISTARGQIIVENLDALG